MRDLEDIDHNNLGPGIYEDFADSNKGYFLVYETGGRLMMRKQDDGEIINLGESAFDTTNLRLVTDSKERYSKALDLVDWLQTARCQLDGLGQLVDEED